MARSGRRPTTVSPPPPRPPAAAAPAAPGPAPRHPAPTARRRAPPFSRGPRRPEPSLAPVPGAPRAPLLGRVAPPCRSPPTSARSDPLPSRRHIPAARGPSPGLRYSRRARTSRSPGPARHSTPRRPEPPPSARDSPGHPRTDPHTGAIFRSQASARPELVLRGARAHCEDALVSLRRPCLSLPLGFLSFFSLSRSPFRADFSSRWVLKGLAWARQGDRSRESRRVNSYRCFTRT